MPTLAPKLPWQHAFAGGYPGRSGQALPTDPDAIDYLNRVAAADGGVSVEVGIAQAIDAFVRGCKADSAGYAGDPTRTNWDAIKSACIMCGARTLSGALVSLRKYGVEEFVNQTPTINDGGGSVGAYDSATRTMSITGVGAENTRPRFDFNMGRSLGVTYKFEGRLSGDLSKVYRVLFADTVVATGASLVANGGVFSSTITSNGYPPYFYLDGTQAPSSVRIDSLSMKAVINDATNVANNFTSSDYSRSGATPGLKGNGSTKYLNTNRAGNADGQDDYHLSAYQTAAAGGVAALIGSTVTSPESRTSLVTAGADYYPRINNSTGALANYPGGNTVGLFAASRALAASYVARSGTSENFPLAVASTAHQAQSVYVFSQNVNGSPADFSGSRLAFYSIGSSLSLSALDARVSTLVSQIAAAIP